MFNHLIAFLLGFVLDQIIGDPYNVPHPIRLIGSLIGFLDRKLMGPKDKEKAPDERNGVAEFYKGVLMCVIVLLATLLVTLAVVLVAYRIHQIAGIALEAVLTCYILAAKSLKDESMKVYDALRAGTIEDARFAGLLDETHSALMRLELPRQQ